MDFWDGVLPTVQHVVEGRKRLGHMFTYGSCPWHHQGYPPKEMSNDAATFLYGPSLAHGRKIFEDHYAPERKLVILMDSVVSHAEQMRSVGEMMTEDRFGLIVRQEAAVQLNRAVSVSM